MPRRLRIAFAVLIALTAGAHAATTHSTSPKPRAAHAAATTAAKPAHAAGPSAAAPTAERPPVELIESVPLETSLGNPRLRHAAAVWPELIRSATTSIDLEQFYLSTWPKEPLEPVIAALVEAAKRGVRVRLLLDARMHKTYPQPADSLGRVPGLLVRTIDIGKIAGGVQHSKYFLIDGQTVYVGSQNFDWRSLEHIHELGVRIHDERVATRFQQVFDMDWAAAGLQATGADSSGFMAMAPPAGMASELPIRIVQAPGDTVELWPGWTPPQFSPDSTLWDRERIVHGIDAARSEVVGQSLGYAVDDRGQHDDAIDQALRRAAARGARVKLLISDWEAGSDKMKALDSLAQVPNIEVRLSSVPEWSKAYIPFARVEHCKYVVVDTTVTWVGTSNLEPSYFHTTRNLGVTMRNRPLAREARDVFEASWTAAAAHVVKPGVTFPARTHGATGPAGVTVYGQ